MNHSFHLTSVSALASSLLAATLAMAADLPKEGRFEAVFCWSGTNNEIVWSKTHSARSYEMTGAGRSMPPGGLFDNSTFRCVGHEATFDGKLRSATTTCESVDPDGDKRLSYFTLADGKTVREQITGTGKYEGIQINTTVTPLGPFPTIKNGTFQSCNQQTGTYRLR